MTAKTVLVVDDEFGIVEVLESALSDHGYRVTTAFNGEQALARIGKSRPDMIMTDYMMPGMNGRRLLEAIAARGELADIPIVLMSSVDEAALRGSGVTYRAFLRKPFRLSAALDIVSAIIGEAA